MKRRELILFIILFFGANKLIAQKILTLRECYDKAYTTNALSGEKIGYTDISRLKDENLAKGWLPTLDANGSLYTTHQ